MMKFSLSKSEGGYTFLAAGAHYRYFSYESYQITGTWGLPSEDGKIPVEIKITYCGKSWLDIVGLKGVFDPEESSLKGAAASNTIFPEEFVFKRNPDFVRLYPAPSAINALERWVFVKTSIMDRVRRQAWSSKRILKKLKDRKRFIELSVKLCDSTVMSRDEDEAEEYEALTFHLCVDDLQFCASIINVRLSKTIRFPYVTVPESYSLSILTISNALLIKHGLLW